MGQYRSLLRTATHAQHRALDQQLAGLDLARSDCYRSFLEASAAAVVPLEARLDASAVSDHFPDWPQRRRAELLCEDIAALGGKIVPLQLAAAPLSTAAMFGVLYVLEGSRLGARVLLQRVPPSIRARRYLSAGDTTLWPTFLASLETTTLEVEIALQAAVRTFGLFQQAFARCLTIEAGHRSSVQVQ